MGLAELFASTFTMPDSVVGKLIWHPKASLNQAGIMPTDVLTTGKANSEAPVFGQPSTYEYQAGMNMDLDFGFDHQADMEFAMGLAAVHRIALAEMLKSGTLAAFHNCIHELRDTAGTEIAAVISEAGQNTTAAIAEAFDTFRSQGFAPAVS